jgi:autotransporter-associated beta strand protein
LSSVAFGVIAISAGCIFPASQSLAQVWNGAGTAPSNYNDPTNWTPNGVPGFTATFGTSAYYGTLAAPITANGVSIQTWDFSTAPQTYYLNITGNSNNFSGLGVIGSAANITNNAFTTFGNPTTLNANLGGATYINNGGIWIGEGSAQTANITNTANLVNPNYAFGLSVPLLEFQGGSSTAFEASAGSSTITNYGVVQFQFSSTAANSHIDNFNQLYFNEYTTAASAVITTESGGRTYFSYDPGDPAGERPDGGSSRQIIKGGGTLDISGMSDGSNAGTPPYGNPVTLTVGSIEGAGDIYLGANTLAVGNLNTNTEFSGVIHDGASPTALADSIATSNFGYAPGGAGSLDKIGTGTLILSGNNTYTGGTTITSGTLQLGNGGSSGSIVGSVANGGTLAFDRSDTYTFAGAISDNGPTAGNVTQIGLGTTILTAANNSYTGATTVNAGELIVDGSIASSALTTVNAGGLLGGNGIIGNTAISGGTLAPGNPPGDLFGPLTVQGNLSFTAASTYMIQVTPANAGRTNVTGTATPGGATVNASFAAGSYVVKQYTILNAAGGVTGTFGSLVNTNLPANFTSSLSYDANNAYLNLTLNYVPPSSPYFGGGLSTNQQQVANALTNFFNSTGGIPLAFGALSPAGLTQVSGEVATGSQQTTFDAMNLFMGVLTDPFIAGRDGVTGGAGATPFADDNDSASAYAAKDKPRSKGERDAYAAIYRKAPVMADPFAPRWSVWAAGFGGSQTTDGNVALGSSAATSRVYGTAVGADYRFSPGTLAGFALAGGGTNFSIANTLSTGRSDLFQAGAFIRHDAGPAYISGALAYGWQDITTDRTVTVAGVDQLRAEFNANAFSGRVEGGYRFVTPWMGGVGLTPYAAGQFTTFDLPAYAEQALSGASTFALGYNAKDVTDTRSELGIRTDKSFAMQDSIFILRSRVAWAHDFNPDRSIAATFQTLPGASFVVNGAAQASDAALTTVSAEIKWPNGFSLAGTFEGEFSDVTRSYAGKGVARYNW